MSQLKENIESVDVNLSQEILDKFDSIHAALPNPTPEVFKP